MAHESFEDETIAAQVNENFVAIKVDREERPDIDAVYMDATVAMTEHGGWPMTVFLDRRPTLLRGHVPPDFNTKCRRSAGVAGDRRHLDDSPNRGGRVESAHRGSAVETAVGRR